MFAFAETYCRAKLERQSTQTHTVHVPLSDGAYSEPMRNLARTWCELDAVHAALLLPKRRMTTKGTARLAPTLTVADDTMVIEEDTRDFDTCLPH